ncbi:hypothetical protein [Streptomyces sp. NPDC055105]|uniref:hypothetical protein n=1 Tax=Streptomyces sp. NPDC055105 TaxID=3365719 RepID=UPI0037D0B956
MHPGSAAVVDEPVTLQINELVARAPGVRAHYRTIPAPLLRPFADRTGYEYLATDALRSNARLTSPGFHFEHPPAREGLSALLSASPARLTVRTARPPDPRSK